MSNTVVLDIGGTNIKYGLVNNETHTLTAVGETPTEAKLGGPALMQKAISLVKGFTDFDRIGVSTCGQVDTHTGSILFASDNVPNYTGTRIKDILEAEFHVPVTVENDVNAAALGESHYGSAKGYGSCLCITYGTGIGGAIIIDGKVFYGSRGGAGEFGHMMTHKGGKPCTCGSQGCYEAYASTGALARLVKQELDREMDGRQIFSALTDNDTDVKRIVDSWIDEIAAGLASLTHIFNPDCIVLGGGIMREPYILEQLNTNITKYAMPSYRNVKLIQAALGNKAGMMGAYYAASRME